MSLVRAGLDPQRPVAEMLSPGAVANALALVSSAWRLRSSW
jgi:hypothetical protein